MANNALTLLTNKQNAQHSTGPRTPAGKRASSLNALRHGLTGNFVLLPSENPEAYRLFTHNLKNDLQPEGALELQMVQTISDTQWRLNRIQSLEAGLFQDDAGLLPATDDSAADDTAGPEQLDRQFLRLQLLGLYEQRLTRILQSTLKLLRLAQQERRAQLKTEFYAAEKIRKLLKSKGLPFHPLEFGFVCSSTQIERAVRREEAIHGPLPTAQGCYSAPQ